MSQCAIRHATLADLPALSRLFDSYRQFYEQAPDLELAHTFLHARMTRGESVLLLAQSPQGQLLGFCQMYPSFCSVAAQPIFVLYDLFVAPTARNTGAGRALLLRAEQHAVTHGAGRLDLSTAKTNHAAHALYESLGWVRDDEFFTYSRTLDPHQA